MIDRIIEAFTKPQIEITAVDEMIQTFVTLGVVFIILFAVGLIMLIKEFIEDERKKRK